MKHSLFLLMVLGLLLPGPRKGLDALEIELTGGINCLAFDPEKENAYKESDDDRQFNGYPFLLGNASLKGNISDKLEFNIRYERDIIFQNTITGKIKTNLDYLNVEFGSFIGLLDNPAEQLPSMGILGGLELFYPGIVFLSLKGSSTMGSQFDSISNNSGETGEVKLGFWLPHIIPAFSVNAKRFAVQADDSPLIINELIRYQFSADFFAKNKPVTFRIDAGYETLSRSYKSAGLDEADVLNALYIGFEAKWQVSRPLRIIAGLEMPVYSWAEEPMEMPPMEQFFLLYKFRAGVAFTFY